MTRRPVIALVLAIAAIALFAGGLAWLLDTPRPPRGSTRGERLYFAYCVQCHGDDGRGSWRAALFLIRPGDLTDAEQMRQESDRYLFDIIKQGGSPIGRPGMPGFQHLPDADVEALVRYMRSLSIRRRSNRSSCGRTASRTRSPGFAPDASTSAGSATTAIMSMAPIPRAPMASWRTRINAGDGRATSSPRTS